MEQSRPTYNCDTCPIRAYAEEYPETFKARMWQFHTLFCPMWNSYQQMTGEKPVNPEPANEVFRRIGMIAGGMLLPLWYLRRRRNR